MKANEAPEKIYIFDNPILDFTKLSVRQGSDDIEYTRTDAFIDKACEFIETYPHLFMGVLRSEVIEDFKNYMKGEYGMDLKNLLEYYLFILNDQSLSYQDKVEVLEGKIKEQLEKM